MKPGRYISLSNSVTQTTGKEPLTLRNAYQWLAIITMLLDHIGYLYNIPVFRYAGRLAMPLYSILFVMTIRTNQVNLQRLLILAAVSQIPYQYLFRDIQLNIIFGFVIFYWTTDAIGRRNWLKAVIGLMMMFIPVSYSWYLYLSLFIFYYLHDKMMQRFSFAILTSVYTYILIASGLHWRQILAVCVPFIEGMKAPRPNKYLYRYFYPGHLIILATVFFFFPGRDAAPYNTPYEDDWPEEWNEYYGESALPYSSLIASIHGEAIRWDPCWRPDTPDRSQRQFPLRH